MFIKKCINRIVATLYLSNEDGGFVAIIDLQANQVKSLDRVSKNAQVTYSMAEVFYDSRANKG